MKQPTLMQQNRVKIADIVIRDRLRPVSEAGVESLLSSIAEVGVLKDAIHLRKKKDGKLYLLAGAHRVEAARRLEWDEIEAKVWTDVTDDWARLIEIDDNLAGSEMNALDTAVFLATRKEVYERLHPQTRHGGDRKGKGFTDQTDMMSVRSFALATAEKFSLTERHVRRMIAAGKVLGPDQIVQLRRAPRAITLADLTAIAKFQPSERYEAVRRLADGSARSAADACQQYRVETGLKAPPPSPNDVAYKALRAAWDKAPLSARRQFVIECEQDIERAKVSAGLAPKGQRGSEL